MMTPRGQSMTPRIQSKQEIKVIPLDRIEVGDVVFCKVKGNYFVHLVTAIKDEQVQIGNNHGHINGWTHRTKVYGRVVDV